ncbi:hypothetical protein BH09ACT4_BH09ACT4_01590 [soil metagenome]
MTKFRHRAALVLSALMLASGLTVVPAVAASAAPDPDAFDAGFIISDGVFFDGSALSAAQIQSFVEGKETSCVSTSTRKCLKDYHSDVASRSGDSFCHAMTGGSNLSAAAILARVATACNVSPKVLLVLLQKEQGLITNAGDSRAYNYAMGWGCPDNSQGCSSAAAGFAYQIYKSAWQFQVYAKDDFGSFKPERSQFIPYQVASVSGCGGRTVFIRNQATAGLYNYTPYQPNSASLKAGYGLGDRCSSYGNRNFWLYFTEWFGNPANSLRNQGFEANPINAKWVAGSAGGVTMKGYIAPDAAHGGNKYLSINASKAGAMIKQSVTQKIVKTGVYTSSIWVQSPAGDATGSLDLWMVGGATTEKFSQPFTATTEWTQVTLSASVANAGHTEARMMLVLQSTGLNVRVDDAQLTLTEVPDPPQQPLTDNGLLNSDFEESDSGTVWVAGTAGGMQSSIYNSAVFAHGGGRYLRMIASAAGARVKQTVVHNLAVGEKYTASVWIRTSAPAPEATGSLQLWAAGAGPIESAQTAFTVHDEWTQVSLQLPIANAGQTELRFIIQVDTPDVYLRADDATLTVDTGSGPVTGGPVAGTTVALSNTGFESGASPWTTGSAGGTRFDSYVSSAYAHSGSRYLRLIADSGGARIKQTRAYSFVSGQSYTGGVWLRAAHEGERVTGELSIWGAGDGETETATAPFDIGDTWTWVGVRFVPARTNLSELRFVVQLDSAKTWIRMDDAQFVVD